MHNMLLDFFFIIFNIYKMINRYSKYKRYMNLKRNLKTIQKKLKKMIILFNVEGVMNRLHYIDNKTTKT